jgi:hypothetical protein
MGFAVLLALIISNLERTGGINVIFIFTVALNFYQFFAIPCATKYWLITSLKRSNPYFMLIKNTIVLLLLVSVAGTALAQKVTRKGMPPIDVSKNKTGKGNKKKSLYNIGQFNGKWQEVSRIDNGNGVDFTDTIYLHFTDTGRVITRNGNTSNMSGSASVEGNNTLLAAADVYTIVAAADSQIVLDNQEGLVHTLRKVNHFQFENYGKDSIKQEGFSNPIPIMLQDVMGKWMVYRKDAKPGAINPPVNIIQNLKITDSTGENTANGEITFYQTDKSIAMPCRIKVTNAGLDIESGDFSWSLFVYKANKKELIFGDAAVLLYYSKSY